MKVTNRPQMDKAVQIAFPCLYRGESVLGYRYPDATLLTVSLADTVPPFTKCETYATACATLLASGIATARRDSFPQLEASQTRISGVETA
jgi:hypothetical protein